MPDLSTIIQILSYYTALFAIIISIGSFFISIGSFYYDKKPLIHITSKNIGVNFHKSSYYEFFIKNISQNPAKDIQAKVKLIYNEETYDIGEYKLDYLNPEDEEFIKDMNRRIVSVLEKKIKLLKSIDSIDPEDSGFDRTSREFSVLEKYYEDNGSGSIISYEIEDDFKINIEFKINCRADIPISMRDKFRYNFEVYYIKYDIYKVNLDITLDHILAIKCGYEDNFYLIMKPSNGKWK